MTCLTEQQKIKVDAAIAEISLLLNIDRKELEKAIMNAKKIKEPNY